MAYNIGQFRRTSNLNDYYEEILNNIQIQQYFQQRINELGSNIFFKNAYYDFSTTDNRINKQNFYYLNFSVKRITSTQNFYLKLENFTSDNYEGNALLEENNQQTIAELTVPQTTLENEWIDFEIIIAPNKNYGQLYWELRRTISDDYKNTSDQVQNGGAIGREMKIIINKFAIINNILGNINNVVKIGVQGPPSLLMCINGEQIRIGKTGIFEINEDNFIISFVGFIPKVKNNILEYFIMDYEYS